MATKASKNVSKTDAAAMSKAIRMCVESGSVVLGERITVKKAMAGAGKLVIVAANAPAEKASDIRRYCELSNLPVVIFAGTSMELGSVCGKPFPVSMMIVSEVGNSPIMDFTKKEKGSA